MHARIASKLFPTAGLAALLALASCQDLSSLVTGEKFLLAPKESPRVEVELDFAVRDPFYAPLQGVDRAALEAEMKTVALSLADVGLRFYPVASSSYGAGDARPERRMVIEVERLDLAIDEDTVEKEGEPLRIVATVEGVTCLVRARVEKRRSNGPPLVVGAGEAQGRVRPGPATEETALLPTFAVPPAVAGHEGLRVEKQDVLDAFEEGAVDALRAVVKAVDRDLAASGGR